MPDMRYEENERSNRNVRDDAHADGNHQGQFSVRRTRCRLLLVTLLTGCFSSWQWQFTGVWTAVHRRTCRTTAFRSLVSTLGSICVPPTVNYLQYLATGSTLMAVRPSQSPAPQPGTLSRISSRTQPSVKTISDVCLKHTCSLDTSTFSALEVLDDDRAL